MENEAGEMLKKNEQVFISMDGPDGLIIQTSRATWESYYRLLGYELLGPAASLFAPPRKRQKLTHLPMTA